MLLDAEEHEAFFAGRLKALVDRTRIALHIVQERVIEAAEGVFESAGEAIETGIDFQRLVADFDFAFHSFHGTKRPKSAQARRR
ncbi:MAG TPA: hypothetical protein VKH64_08960 [Candidatus Binatia bacterium]|nr:hypothetical protein [Candidatus Binatia bacterium]